MSANASARHRLPPGPRGGPVMGNSFAYLRDQLGYLTAAVAEYGDIVKLRLGNLTTYVLVNPDHIDYVLRAHADNFIKDRMTRWLIPLVGEGLLTSEAAVWRRQRRLTQPTFQRQQIERYATVMVEQTERMLATWRDGEVRDLHNDMSRLTLAIVAKTLFGTDLSAEADVIGESLEVVINHFMSPMRWFRFIDYLPLPSSRRYWQAIRQIDEVIYRIIRHHRASGHDTGGLLSRLLAARDEQGGAGMSDRQLRDEVVTLVLAGHETTALVLFYAFYLLASSPETADRLAAELREVLGGRATDRRRHAELALYRMDCTRVDATLSAGLGYRSRGARRLRDRRLFRSQRHAAFHGPATGSPRPAMVRRSGDVHSRALGSRSDQAAAALRVFSIW